MDSEVGNGRVLIPFPTVLEDIHSGSAETCTRLVLQPSVGSKGGRELEDLVHMISSSPHNLLCCNARESRRSEFLDLQGGIFFH